MTNTPGTPLTESNLPEPAVSKASLSQFIKEHSKLVTGIAAFVGLTAFSSQLSNNDIRPLFPALTFLAAALLALELLMKLPEPPREWRLEIFSMVLAVLVIMMGWYWRSNFPVVWVPALLFLIEIVVLIGLAALLTYLLMWIIGLLATKLLKREMQTYVRLRITQVLFVCCAFLVVAGLVWTSRKLAAHPITIHIPKII
jgi:hypothetical protein